jgi:hypothetical protein
MRLVHLVLVLAHVSDELLKIGRREGPLGEDEDRRAGGQPDRGEILGRVVLEVGIERGGGTVRAHVAHHDDVAVGLAAVSADQTDDVGSSSSTATT